MIEDELELRHAYKTMGRLEAVRARCAVEPAWEEEMRQQVVAGIEAQMRKIERQITEYLRKHCDAEAA